MSEREIVLYVDLIDYDDLLEGVLAIEPSGVPWLVNGQLAIPVKVTE